MARDENRGAAFGHVCDERTEDVAPDDGVESVRRLVQHEQIAALRQREQNHQLRFLTLGQTTEEMLAVELETLDQILRPRAIPPRIEGRLEIDQLANRERRVEMRLLGHVTDAAEDVRVLIWHREPEDRDASADRSQQAQDEANRGGLA